MRLPRTFDGLDFPVRRSYFGEPVPDLTRLEPKRWREVLSQISPGARRAAVATATGPGVGKAMTLVAWLDLQRPDARWTPPTPPAAPGTASAPGADGADADHADAARDAHSTGTRAATRDRERRSLQVHIRLREHERRTLARAAEVAGLLPAQLARMLVVQGATRLLIQEDALRRRLRESDA